MPVNQSLGSHAEEILHFGGVRLRVSGIGNLAIEFQSLDHVFNQGLTAIPMNNFAAIEPTRLANFVSQRALIKIGTTNADEKFVINRVIVFIKPIYSQYPG